MNHEVKSKQVSTKQIVNTNELKFDVSNENKTNAHSLHASTEKRTNAKHKKEKSNYNKDSSYHENTMR